MKRNHAIALYISAALSFLASGVVRGQEVAAQQDGVESWEVLTAGPVHEAFAGTVNFNPEPGIVAPKAPPEAIEELPPDQMPDGVNVAWIPGYWAWDDDHDDFLWVSGIWRELPPGRQWVPGYWGQAAHGFQWTSGYWADARASEIEYLPEPPQSIENGPNIEATSPDQNWLPGCWIWQNNRYAWRPGYWAQAQPNWLWVPDSYSWTPRGYVFVNGYWDSPISRRGVLFAPVYFPTNTFRQPGFVYSPATVINPALFLSHLFVQQGYNHYYFGDYYAARYSQAGYYPGYAIHNSRSGYDPIYSYQRWQNRNDQNWDRGVHANYERLRQDEHARPPRTWSAQRQLSDGAAQDSGLVVAAPLHEVVTGKDQPLQFQPLDAKERQRLAQHGRDVQQFGQERQKLERQTASVPTEGRSPGNESARVKLPESPVRGKPIESLGGNDGPLTATEAPKPDPTIEPKPRVGGSPKGSRPLPGVPPQPGVDRSTPRVGQPIPRQEHRVERPVLKQEPRVERPAPKQEPQSRVEQPRPKPQAKPQAPARGGQPRLPGGSQPKKPGGKDRS